MHFAAPHGEIDAVDRLQAAEIFGEAAHVQHEVGAGGAARFRRDAFPRSGRAQRERLGRRRGGRSRAEQASNEAPDAVGHEDDDQNDRGAVDREIEAGHALEEAQPFRDEDQEARADGGADRRGDAAEQRHRQQHDRIGKSELVGAHVGKTAREESAAEAAEPGAEREGRHLGAEDVDARGAGGEFIVAHRAHRAPQPRIRQAPDEIARNREGGDRQCEKGLPRGEQRGPPDRTDAVGPMGEADRVDEDDGQDLLERDRDHRQIMAAQPQGRDAEQRARGERDRDPDREAEPEGQAIVRRAEAHGIGPEREERGLREIDLPAQPQNDREAEDGDRVGRGLHQNVGDVVVGLHSRGERDENGGDGIARRRATPPCGGGRGGRSLMTRPRVRQD